MQQLPAALRCSLGFIASGAVLGAAIGFAHGIRVVAENDYQQQSLTDLARWVLVDSASTGMQRGALWAFVVLAVVFITSPILRIALGDWRRALTGAALAIPVLALYLLVGWYVNRFYLPEALSAWSLSGNLLLVVLAIALWYALLRLTERRQIGARLAKSMTWARPLPLLAIVLAAFAVQSSRVIARPQAGRQDAHVLLIVIDALRPDRLGVYGYGRDTSPHLDALAGEGWRYLNAVSTAPWTKPSIASLFTGLYPRSHGIASASWNLRDDQGVATVAALPRSSRTLPEILANAGYRTGAFGRNHHLVTELGFDQGFDVHEMALECGALRSAARRLGLGIANRLASSEGEQCRTATRINERFLEWLPDGDNRFFAYLHHIDVHWPYDAPKPYTERFGRRRSTMDFNSQDFYATFGPEREADSAPPQLDPAVLQDMSDAYDEGIRFVDDQIGALFAELKRRDLYDRTLIIVTADHGEQFLEHGEIGHGTSLHDVLLHVPLIIKFPCPGEYCEARTIEEQVQLVDLTPTILDVVGIEVAPAMAGRSLVRPLEGDRVLFAENGEQAAVRTNQFKFIYDLEDSRAELYALHSDPGEQRNLAASDPELTLALRDRLFQWIEETDQNAAAPREEVAADGKMLERLKALGYVK